MSQSIPVYLHQIMHDLSDSGDLPQQKSVYPKVDADPEIGTIRYVLIHKDLMPESKISTRGAMSLQAKYAIRHVAGPRSNGSAWRRSTRWSRFSRCSSPLADRRV